MATTTVEGEQNALAGLSFKAILAATVICTVVDLVGVLVLGLVLGLVLALSAWSRPGATAQDMVQALTRAKESGWLTLAASVLGTLTVVVGGFVAARLASQRPYLNAGVFGALGIALGFLFFGEQEFWFDRGASFVLTIPAALLGAYLAKPHCPQPPA
jgi:hypothetical protein